MDNVLEICKHIIQLNTVMQTFSSSTTISTLRHTLYYTDM